MAIYPQSRYVQGTLVRMLDSNGVYQLSVLRTTPAATVAFTLYVWQVGDRPDIVAQQLLGNSSLWWSIIDINPEIINPIGIPAGYLVRIPTGPIEGQGTLIQ
jgi:hypothetical protein